MFFSKEVFLGTSLAVQWLRLSTSPARGMGFRELKIPHAALCNQKKSIFLQSLNALNRSKNSKFSHFTTAFNLIPEF